VIDIKIAVDIDGVLADILHPLATRIKADFGHDIQPDHLEKFELADTLKEFGIKSTWLLKCFKDEWFWSQASPYEDNIATVNAWREKGHEIHLVTGREQFTAIATSAWLKKYKVGYDKLQFSRVMKKYEYMLEENIPVIFEDRVFEANKCGSYGLRAFVVRRPYNLEYESRVHNSLVSYVDTLSDADSFLESFEEFAL